MASITAWSAEDKTAEEIIPIPLSGTLRHQDSRGASHIIVPGDVHVLSAGLGVTPKYNGEPTTGEGKL